VNARSGWLLGAWACAGIVCAQAPVEDGRRTLDAVLDAQQKAGAAYHDWQDAQAERARSEEEFKQATAAYQSARQQLNESDQRVAAAKKALEAAQTREAAARSAYDKATATVDRAWGKKAPAGK